MFCAVAASILMRLSVDTRRVSFENSLQDDDLYLASDSSDGIQYSLFLEAL